MKKYYFVGNAHLDPVWMWRWQEGSAEAKATVRSALDRMKEYPEFIFVCSSASVYKWIEEFDAAMFLEIKERVKEGRFIIVGGWFTQPDCNLPSGEGFARQSLYCQRYFHDRFGITARTGYNVDSFGHNLMLPQILKKSGMSEYIFMRPGPHENATVPEVFLWRSPDGSEIPTYKIHNTYCNNFASEEDMVNKLSALEEYLPAGSESSVMFYGVGNHGGGPTKQNIEYILSQRAKNPDKEYIFSTVADYFDEIKAKGTPLPVYDNDLQHHASGCYSAVSLIKTLIRKSENELLSAESFNMLSSRLCGKKYITEKLASAWENVLFCHFHDIAGGCSLEDAYTDASYMLGESIAFAEREKNNALQTVSWAIDTSDAAKGYPIVIFNPLPFETERVVQINQIRNLVSSIEDKDGVAVPIQYVLSQSVATYGRDDVIFRARIPALGYATYYIKSEPYDAENTLIANDLHIENEYLSVDFEAHTGYITRIYDKENERELLSGFGAVPTVIDETGHDTWSHAKNFFDKKIAVFSDARVRLIESGPVRATVEVVSSYCGSTLTANYSLAAGERHLTASCELDWREKHKMLKIAFETAAVGNSVLYEIPFGEIRRPADGEEEPGQRWFAAEDGTALFAICNSNKYSFSVKDNVMYLTAVRSPLYADHGNRSSDRCRFTDRGAHRFDFTFGAYAKNGRTDLIKDARMLNTPAEIIIENNHSGRLAAEYSGIFCDKENVQISSVKRAEDGTGTVIRVYETDGKEADFTVGGDILPSPLKAKITPYSICTYALHDGTSEWREVLLSEFDM